MELLLPSGNLELALAAFDGGADAVYCGLSGLFNARMRAPNFSFDELGKLIRYAREHGKKVYVTLNTLVKEDELGAMFETLLSLSKLKVDAVIVQDPGVIYCAGKYFPGLTLHGSTQMGIHNSAGVKAAERIGLKRVILERQISLPELREIAAASPLELEVFIHGSLCCSLSGRCLLSGFMYGQSGNRGRCKQPCRRYFETPAGGGYWLSPGDLDGRNILEELKALNVASLKVEGRLRTPDYVWKCARAYRMMLDNDLGRQPEVWNEAGNLLNSALSRRPTPGFYDVSFRKKLITPASPGNFGIPAAVVEKVMRRGMLVTSRMPLHLGDRLRFIPERGGDGESFTLSALESAPGRKILKSSSNQRLFIPGSFKAVAGWKIYKIGENGFDFSRQASALPELMWPLDMHIRFRAERLEIRCGGIEIGLDCSFTPAERHPVTAEAVAEIFRRGAVAPWCAGEVAVEVEGRFFAPVAELKRLRREFWEKISPQLNLEEYFAGADKKLELFYQEMKNSTASGSRISTANSVLIPPFIPEVQLAEWRGRVADAYRSGVRHFKISSWHGFGLLEELREVTGAAVFPLPVTNSRSAALMAGLGCSEVEAAPELDCSAAAALKKTSPLPVTDGTGKVPLLVTRIPLPEGRWQDERGRSFQISGQDGLFTVSSEEDERAHFASQQLL